MERRTATNSVGPTQGGQPVCVRASHRCVTDATDPNVQTVTAGRVSILPISGCETDSDLATNIGAATATHHLPSPGNHTATLWKFMG